MPLVKVLSSFPAQGWIIQLQFFYNDGFGIKLPTKADKSLNNGTKPNQTYIVLTSKPYPEIL